MTRVLISDGLQRAEEEGALHPLLPHPQQQRAQAGRPHLHGNQNRAPLSSRQWYDRAINNTLHDTCSIPIIAIMPLSMTSAFPVSRREVPGSAVPVLPRPDPAPLGPLQELPDRGPDARHTLTQKPGPSQFE